MSLPLSILDLAPIRPGESASTSFSASVELAQRAEDLGYHRIWYAEHHNMSTIASSATSVLIAHVGARTSRIRLGAGGVMLPNHSPLVIAEQFGTLEALYPDRIDLGLGRAPGSDLPTMRALRRNDASADRFPDDVVELRGYLRGESVVPGVTAVPGHGAHVPLYILGSSLFGAQLAALLGLPYAFASHFSPDALEAAVARYRAEFRPSPELAEPYVIAGVNVIAAASTADAKEQLATALRRRAAAFLARGREVDDDEAEMLLASPAGAHVRQMIRYRAVGTAPEVAEALERFAQHADADELMLVLQSPTGAGRLASLELVAGSMLAATAS